MRERENEEGSGGDGDGDTDADAGRFFYFLSFFLQSVITNISIARLIFAEKGEGEFFSEFLAIHMKV